MTLYATKTIERLTQNNARQNKTDPSSQIHICLLGSVDSLFICCAYVAAIS